MLIPTSVKTTCVTPGDHLWYPCYSCYVVARRHPRRERMARKPSDVIQIKIRVREDLRRKLEQAATKADRSINSEMASRLANSFNLPKLNEITARLEENVFERLAHDLRDRSQREDLMCAAEYLIEQLPAEVRGREAVKRAIAEVQNAITAIAHVHGRDPEEG